MVALSSRKKSFSLFDSMFRYAKLLQFGGIHIKFDLKTGLQAIIAVHNLKRGPAIGGCRFVHYESIDRAFVDVLRLAQMMSYKAAINDLPHGGAKAVIIKPAHSINKTAYFTAFGDFVQELGGQYITAVDSGTDVEAMDIIASRTAYVTCNSGAGGGDADPSPLTALGVRRGMEAAVKFALKRESLQGIRVAIQGAGHVGYALAKDIVALGAEVTICDVNVSLAQRVADELHIARCNPSEIYHLDVDVFSPCALGAVINLKTIGFLRAKLIVGAANNQLAHQRYARFLQERGIVYAPDFLVNAGGLIHVATIHGGGTLQHSLQKISEIYDSTLLLLEEAEINQQSPNDLALDYSRKKLGLK